MFAIVNAAYVNPHSAKIKLDRNATYIQHHTDYRPTCYVSISGVDTGGSGGSMNRGPRAPGGPERYNMIFYITCNMEK